MDLEETKKIIESKIEAEAVTKNVRSKIKSYIHEKQNLTEGFKETFKPLSSQDKVKESIDNQQNAMIKQLQENQLALTEGLDKNIPAITQGFSSYKNVPSSSNFLYSPIQNPYHISVIFCTCHYLCLFQSFLSF